MQLNRAQVHELYNPGHSVTARADADLTLGSFVAITTGTDRELPTVTTAEAGARAFGIAATDAETGDKLTIARANGRCFQVPTTASIPAGADIAVGEAGKPAVAAEGDTIVAYALRASTDTSVDLSLI